MKVLIRFNKEDNSFVDFQTVNSEYNHIYQEVEELPFKEGFYVEYKYNKEQDKVIGDYVEIPKPPTQVNEEKLKQLEDVIYNLQEKIYELSPDGEENPLSEENEDI